MQVDLVYGDDWQGLYFDGNLVMENHILRLEQALQLLSNYHIDSLSFFKTTADEKWLEHRGSLPAELKDVKRIGDP